MVVMVTASERNRVPHKCSMARRDPHTHTTHTNLVSFPFLTIITPFQRLKFTQFCDVLQQAEKHPTSVTETYSDFLEYSEKSHCFGQIYKLFYCSARSSFELLFFITDVLSSRPCCEIKWY